MGSYSEKLRTLCLNTGWKYAVFWKFKYRARMSVLSFFFLIFFFFPFIYKYMLFVWMSLS